LANCLLILPASARTLRLSHHGCYFKYAVSSGYVPSLSGIKVVDTTGAGDIFGGSAVWKLLQLNQAPDMLNEEQLRDVVTFACTSVGLSTTKHGGISSVPEYEDILKNLNI
jgi:fructokinase